MNIGNTQAVIGFLALEIHDSYKKGKRTFCSECFKDQEKMIKNFKIFEKMTAYDWLKIDILQIDK